MLAAEWARASGRHLGFRQPVILFRTTKELEQSAQTGGLAHLSSSADPSGQRMLFAVDHPADQWFGLLTHEVARVFGFDIIPGTATPRWIVEGLAAYVRGAWDPSDLVTLRDAVRANAIPKLSGLDGTGSGRDTRLVYGFGHAAFDFIESRWGKGGVRQFLFGLPQTALQGGDPYGRAFQISRDEFDRDFERYLVRLCQIREFARQIGSDRF